MMESLISVVASSLILMNQSTDGVGSRSGLILESRRGARVGTRTAAPRVAARPDERAILPSGPPGVPDRMPLYSGDSHISLPWTLRVLSENHQVL
jgi:hypothetical protein